MQTYVAIPSTTTLVASRGHIVDRTDTLRSNWSGTSHPASPVAGQTSFRTDLSTIYLCTNATGPVWSRLADVVGSFSNTALKVRDTDDSHDVSIIIGSNVSSSRTLTFVTGDANRSVDVANLVYANVDAILSGAIAFTSSTQPRVTRATQSAIYYSNAAATSGYVAGRDLQGDNGHNYFVYDTLNAAARFYISSSGFFGFNTAAVSSIATMTDAGDVSWQYGASRNSTSVFYVYNFGNTGVYLTNGNTSWSASSDERIKTIIGDLSAEDSLGMIMQLRPIRYRLKSDEVWAAAFGGSARERVNFGAAETLAVLPEVVDVPPNYDPEETTLDPADPEYLSKTLGLRREDMIPRMVHAMQQLTRRVEMLEAA